jgi:hypothetical protein
MRDMHVEVQNVQNAICIALAVTVILGVVYNNARIALATRARELGSLRVLGFSTHEIAWVLVGGMLVELAIATPIGLYLGHSWARLVMQMADQEQFRWEAYVAPSTYLVAVVVGCRHGGSALWRDVASIGSISIAVLKTRRTHGHLERNRHAARQQPSQHGAPADPCLRRSRKQAEAPPEVVSQALRAPDDEDAAPASVGAADAHGPSGPPHPPRARCRGRHGVRAVAAPGTGGRRAGSGAASWWRSRRPGSRGEGPARGLRAGVRQRLRQILEPGETVWEGDAVAEIAPSPRRCRRATRPEAQARPSAAISALGQSQAQHGRAKVARSLLATSCRGPLARGEDRSPGRA